MHHTWIRVEGTRSNAQEMKERQYFYHHPSQNEVLDIFFQSNNEDSSVVPTKWIQTITFKSAALLCIARGSESKEREVMLKKWRKDNISTIVNLQNESSESFSNKILMRIALFFLQYGFKQLQFKTPPSFTTNVSIAILPLLVICNNNH